MRERNDDVGSVEVQVTMCVCPEDLDLILILDWGRTRACFRLALYASQTVRSNDLATNILKRELSAKSSDLVLHFPWDICLCDGIVNELHLFSLLRSTCTVYVHACVCFA